jgi:hypothetical protein
MARIVKNLLKSSATISLCLYVVLLILSSLEHYLGLFVNLVGLSYAISQLTNNKVSSGSSSSSSIVHYLIRFSIGNLMVMHVMVQSYAELLPYEIGVHVILYAVVYYFYYCYRNAFLTGSSQASVFDFKRTSYLEKKAYG